MRYYKILVLAVLCQILSPGLAQQALLEKKISIQCQKMRLATVLAILKSKYGVQFSYANNLIPLDKKITIQVSEMPLNQALEEIFNESGIGFSQVGNQIVLRKEQAKAKKKVRAIRPKLESKPQEKKAGLSHNNSLENTMDESATSSILPIPALTEENENGKPLEPEELQKEYKDEKRTLAKNYMAQLDAALETGDSSLIGKLKKEFKDLGKELDGEFERLSEKIQKAKWNPFSDQKGNADSNQSKVPVQVSLIPPLSTNGADNARKINELSFNIWAGYSGGLEGLEIGGIANVEKGNVKGVQVSGFANVVKGDVSGVQAASFINIQKGKLEAVQLAGSLNISGSDSSNAFQASGFMNAHKGDLFGGQVAGFLNINGGYLIGPQVAGFLNVAKGPVSGSQVAGFININGGNLQGAQVAGFMNVSRHVVGTQVSGFLNISKKELRGAQVSGFLNIGKGIKGSQIGIVNIADSVSGPQIGLISISKKGYRRLEFFGAERIQANVAFRMGSRTFHNLFLFGVNPLESKPRWSYGYGFGSEFDLGKKIQMNLDLVCNQIIENEKLSTQNLNLLNQLKLNFGWRPGKRTTLFAGPILNVAVSKVTNKETGEIGSNVIPDWAFFKETEDLTTVAMWVGLNAGLRF